MSGKWVSGLAAIALSCVALQAQAVPIVFTGSTGGLSSAVSFDISGGNLQVQLTNTSLGNPSAPGNILSGVIFSIAGNPLLTKISATLAAGSTVIHGPTPATDPGGAVGGEWAYSNSLAGAFIGQQSIYSSGYFDGNAVFSGSNLQGPGSVNGIQYGITTINDTAGNDNGGLTGNGLIQNSVVFVLGGLPQLFALSMISDVSFQYGTSLEDTNIPGTCTVNCGPGVGEELPEPPAVALLAVALLAGCLVRQRRSPDA